MPSASVGLTAASARPGAVPAEHHEEARGIGAVGVDQGLRIDAVVLRFRHGADAARFDRLAVGLEDARPGMRLPLSSSCDSTSAGVEIGDAPAAGFAEENLVQHHALGEQVGEGLVELHQPQVAHHLGPEARVEQVQDGVLDAADVLVDGHPVIGARSSTIAPALSAQASGRSTRTSRRRCPWCRSRAAPALPHLGQAQSTKSARLLQRIAGPSGTQSSGSTTGNLVVGHRHVAPQGSAVDDRNRRAPVALARDAPVAQAVGGLLFAQAPGARSATMASVACW